MSKPICNSTWPWMPKRLGMTRRDQWRNRWRSLRKALSRGRFGQVQVFHGGRKWIGWDGRWYSVLGK